MITAVRVSKRHLSTIRDWAKGMIKGEKNYSVTQNPLENVLARCSSGFVVASMPTPIRRYSRAARSNICSSYHIQPTSGYCAPQKKQVSWV